VEAATNFNSKSKEMVILSCRKGLPFLIFQEHALIICKTRSKGGLFTPVGDGHIVGSDINNVGLASCFNVKNSIRTHVAIAAGHKAG
jgi:hypothetical protein